MNGVSTKSVLGSPFIVFVMPLCVHLIKKTLSVEMNFQRTKLLRKVITLKSTVM